MQNIEKIYKEYSIIVKKYLFCLTHDNDIAEELTQETFYRAMKKIHTFKGECKISVWLCQIAKNLWLDELKKRKSTEIMMEKISPFSSLFETAEDIVVRNEEKNILYQQLQKLDNISKEVTYLRIYGNLSFKEIATILNKTEAWARIIFYRSKQKLKEVDSYEKEK